MVDIDDVVSPIPEAFFLTTCTLEQDSFSLVVVENDFASWLHQHSSLGIVLRMRDQFCELTLQRAVRPCTGFMMVMVQRVTTVQTCP